MWWPGFTMGPVTADIVVEKMFWGENEWRAVAFNIYLLPLSKRDKGCIYDTIILAKSRLSTSETNYHPNNTRHKQFLDSNKHKLNFYEKTHPI